MGRYSQEELRELIECPKTIVYPPRKEMTLDRGHLRNGMRLKSAENKHDFSVFMRQNRDFVENFSIGLVYLPKDGTPEITLIRCNGPHGDVVENALDPVPHRGHHIHLARAENIEAGFEPGKGATLTKDYATFEDALGFFLRKCNVLDAEKYFANIVQLDLFSKREPDT